MAFVLLNPKLEDYSSRLVLFFQLCQFKDSSYGPVHTPPGYFHSGLKLNFFFFFSKKPFSALTPNLLLHFFVYVDIRSQYSLNNLYFSTQPTMILVTKLALGRFIYCIFIIYSFNRSMRAGIMLTLFISVTSVWGIVSLLNEYLLNY